MCYTEFVVKEEHSMRVLIVDDEYLIRHGLATAIDWDALRSEERRVGKECI